MSSRSTHRAHWWSKIALFILWAAFASIAYNIYSEVRELALIGDLEEFGDAEYDPATLDRIDANEERQNHAMYGYLAAMALSTLALLIWTSRANRACRDLGATHMRFTPGWAGAYWLLPIVNLYRPYQVVRELWTTTHPDRRPSPLVKWWWIAWLATGFVSRYGDGMLPADPTLDDFRQADYFYLFSHALDILAFSLAIIVVTRLSAQLNSLADRVSLAAARVVSDSADRSKTKQDLDDGAIGSGDV